MEGVGSYIKLKVDDDIFSLDYDQDAGAYEEAEGYIRPFMGKTSLSLEDVCSNARHKEDLIGILQYQKRYIESQIEHAIQKLQMSIDKKNKYIIWITEEVWLNDVRVNATLEQMKFIYSLLKKTKKLNDYEKSALFAVAQFATRSEASALIDFLKS